MSEAEEILVDAENKQMPLIAGASATGKSASLMNIPDQKGWWYMNCEAGKRLPFRSRFTEFRITEPAQVMEGFEYALDLQRQNSPDMPKGIIVDSLTFLMDMKETQDVLTAANTMNAWGEFQQFFKRLMQEKAAELDIPVIFIAHTLTTYDDEGRTRASVPIKGALKNNGIEAYFSTVIYTKKITIKDLDKLTLDPELLTITEEDRALGYKHVFQTRPTAQTVGESIRAPVGMFKLNQLYMDNDVHKLLKHMNAYYNED